MVSVKVLRARYEAESLPAGDLKKALLELFATNDNVTMEDIEAVKEKYAVTEEKDSMMNAAMVEGEKADGAEDDDVDAAARQAEGLSDAKRGAIATAQAEEWAPYFGMEVETLLQATSGFPVHVFVNKFGGCLRTVKAKFNLDKGIIVFRRAAGDQTFLKVENLKEMTFHPKTIDFFKTFKKDGAVTPDVQEALADSFHCMAAFHNEKYKAKGMGKFKKEVLMKFFFCFDSAEERDLFVAVTRLYQQSNGNPEFTVVGPEPG